MNRDRALDVGALNGRSRNRAEPLCLRMCWMSDSAVYFWALLSQKHVKFPCVCRLCSHVV